MRLENWTLEPLVRDVIEGSGTVPHRSAGTKRIEEVRFELVVVEGILEESLGRGLAFPIANCARIVEAIH